MVETMKKINGRLEPATPHEVAVKSGKPFKCSNEKCGAIQRIENAQFGEDYKCLVCGGELHE